METIKRIRPGHRMGQAVISGPTIYLAGQVADDCSLDVKGQTVQVVAAA